MRASILTKAFMLLALPLVIAGCPKPKDDPEANSTTTLAEDGSDASEMESHVSALTAAVTLSTGNFESPQRAAAAAISTKNFFFPAGCLTSDAQPLRSSVTHTFNGCAGPWGLARVSGTVRVEYSQTTDAAGNPALKLEVNGDELTFRRATVDFQATAVLSGSGADRSMTYDATLSGQTPRGRELSRSVAWKLGWTVGETCLRLDGTATGNVTGRNLKTTIENYQRCRAACPADGGTITLENATGDKLVIKFDGTARAKVVPNGGTPIEVKLSCAG